MPRAVLYTEREGGLWRRLPEEIYVSSMMARDLDPASVQLDGHSATALLFDDGSRWDAVNGFVPDAQTAASVAEILAGLKTA